MLHRPAHLSVITDLLHQFPVVGLIGARQVGKTTLARQIAGQFAKDTLFFDLEDPGDEARLADPMLALSRHRGLVVLDEIQRRPDLFPILRVLADRHDQPARFLVLGSASPDLMRQSAESLAGRIAYHPLPGLDLSEVGIDHWRSLWLRGGFPRSWLATSDAHSQRWRDAFVMTHLERDLPALGLRLSATVMRRFWSMLAHYHGQTWNASEIGRGLGLTDKTVRHYLDVLSSTFMVRRLQPWHVNLGKRQVKAAKVYLTDSGLLHSLLRLENEHDLLGHPKVGASWEGFALNELVSAFQLRWEDCYFWSLHSGAEVDLYFERAGKCYGVEFKFNSAPSMTRSMRSAVNSLKLDHLLVIHPGDHSYPMAERVEAVSLSAMQLWAED